MDTWPGNFGHNEKREKKIQSTRNEDPITQNTYVTTMHKNTLAAHQGESL